MVSHRRKYLYIVFENNYNGVGGGGGGFGAGTGGSGSGGIVVLTWT